MTGLLDDVADAAADLLLGSSCVGCERPGRPLCHHCRAALPTTAALAWPIPTPAGLAPPYATGGYEDTLRALILGHKERGLHSFRGPLGWQLAVAARTATGPTRQAGPLVLVPVPSRGTSVRARGNDPTRVMVGQAARHLRRQGYDARVAPLLRLRPGVADQAGLTAGDRHANLAGSMAVRADVLARLRRTVRRARFLVCDDVLTTGATAREAQRALAAVGIPIDGVATVAATRRHARSSGESL